MSANTVAITIGDPAGIGPEISLKAARHLMKESLGEDFRLLLVGNTEILETTARSLDMPLPPIFGSDESQPLAILPTEPITGDFKIGQVSAEGGRQAYDAIAKAVSLALDGQISGIATGPLNKEALNLAGYHYAGHTEMLADLTGVRDSAMMLAHQDFRVSHVSTHIPLEEVPGRATAERIGRVLDLTHEALIRLGVKQPRIAVAALNPHAGEGGIFGRHDIDITAPVVERYQRKGWNVAGPVPGDTVFVKLKAGQYDAAVAMYHDQGHIPVKLLGFDVDAKTKEWKALSGVNITLGLPIIRTSVDHGTAFDIAGKGIAQENSLVEAVEFAIRLAWAPAP